MEASHIAPDPFPNGTSALLPPRAQGGARADAKHSLPCEGRGCHRFVNLLSRFGRDFPANSTHDDGRLLSRPGSAIPPRKLKWAGRQEAVTFPWLSAHSIRKGIGGDTFIVNLAGRLSSAWWLLVVLAHWPEERDREGRPGDPPESNGCWRRWQWDVYEGSGG